MKIFTKPVIVLLLALAGFFSTSGQSIMQPTDTVYTYNSAAVKGSPTNPNQPATANTIGKWIRTVRMSWNTSNWKCYIYNGVQFRLRFPTTYNPTAVDGKRYPMLVFFHGLGEAGVQTDNEYQLYHGGNVFENKVATGAFDGYILCLQSNGSWGATHDLYVKQIIDYMIVNNKLSPFQVSVNGLSAGGYNSWNFMETYPNYTASALPMSGISIYDQQYVNSYKFTPIWYFQGGLDGSPAQNTADQTTAVIKNAGGNLRYRIFPTLGHGTWDSAWAQTDFFPWISRVYMSNPWTLFGRTQFCPGDPINVTIGVAPGLNGYQWRKDGVALSATTNTITVTTTGTYDCRVLSGSIWSDWSHVPVVIATKAPTITPPITNAPLVSNVIPALDRPSTVLVEPAGYVTYAWRKAGDTTTIGTTSSLTVSTPGQYVARVTEQFGCTSSFTAPFTVISANGPNKPDAASGLTASALSQTSILLNWNQNPTPTYPETGFEIYQATAAGGPYKLIYITAADVIKDTVTGLNSGTKYYYVIRAINGTAASAASNEASAKTIADVVAPSAPTSLVVSYSTRSSITLSWGAATDNVGIAGYDVYVNGAKSYTITDGTQTSFTVYGLNQNQTYAFTVKAKDGAGNISPFSNQVSGTAILAGLQYNYYNVPAGLTALPDFTTLTPASSGVMPNLALTGAGSSNYCFLWQGYIVIPTTGVYNFRVKSDDRSRLWLGTVAGSMISPYSATATPLVNNDAGTSGATVTSANVTLTAGVYPIAIGYMQFTGAASIALTWKTPSSGTNYVTVPNAAFTDAAVVNGTAPTVPSNVIATTLSYNATQVSWKDNGDDETGFEIWRSASFAGTYAVIGTVDAGVTTFTDNTVAANTKYFYQVRSVNLYGQSAFAKSFVEAEWKFNNNYNDSSGNAHTVTTGNSPTFDATTKVEGTHSVKLNGTNQNITIATSATFLLDAYAQRTISCWIKPVVTTGTYRVIWDIGGADDGLALMLNANTLVAAIASNNTRYTITAPFTNTTSWSHVAVVYNGDSLLLYVNGAIVASNTSMSFHALTTTANGARIGQVNSSLANNVSNSTYYSGWIDDFTIFNQALTTAAVGSVMNFNTNGAVSSTTTQVLPGVPAAPTVLTSTALSASSVRINWTNNASNAANIQVYRSANNNQNYVLWATLAGNAVNYTDSSLFSNATYYYKVNAVNPGGTSAYSNETSATTLDVPPVIGDLTYTQLRYGTTTVIPVTATSVNSGLLTFTALNLPAFATLTGTSNTSAKITVNPAITDQGVYNNITIIVADAFGGKDTTKFTLEVNNKYAPTMDSVSNYTLYENDTLSIPLSGHNVNGGDTLSIAVNNLPSAYTLTQTGNGTATLFLHPGYAASGTYLVSATVNDNNGLSATRQFSLTVNDKNPNTKTYMHINAGDSTVPGWNNLNGYTSTGGFIDENGHNTGITLVMGEWWWWPVAQLGANTGNNSGVYPDGVLKDYYFFGIWGGPDTLISTLSGMDTSSLYTLTFFGSSAWDGVSDNGTTAYNVGNKTVTLHVQKNTQNTVTITDIKPNADGTLVWRMWKADAQTPLGYFNSLVITKQFDDGTAPAAPASLYAQNAPTLGGVQLSWVNKAYNETAYQIVRSTSAAGAYSLIGTAPARTTGFVDTTVSGGVQYFYKVNAINGHGVSPYTDSVMIVTSDKIPKVNPIASITLTSGQSTTVNVTTVDDATDHLTLTATNLPAFASFVDNGNGTGTITVAPGAGDNGVYSGATITATDMSDSSRSATFNIYVVENNVSSTYINFTDTAMAPKPWNNLAGIPFAGTTINNLVDDGGVNTGVSLTIQGGFDGVFGHGMRPRNGTNVYPEPVTSTCYFAYSTAQRAFLISGLNPAKTYNFVIFGSYFDQSNCTTIFGINGVTQTLNASYNSSKTIQFNGIKSDASGNVTITMTKDANAFISVISSIVIQAYDPANITPVMAPADLRVTNNTKNSINLQWQDRADSETGYEVWRATSAAGPYTLKAALAANATSYVDTLLSNNAYYYYTVRAVKSGVYTSYSNTVTGYTYSSIVDIAFNSATTSQGPLPWNNLARIPELGYTWSNFINDLGVTTNIGMLETGDGWAGIDAGGGVNTGNNSGIFPDAVLANSYVLFPGQSGSVQLTGLNLSQTYDLTFFASVTGTSDASSIYTVNGKTTILNATLNQSATSTIFGLTPDASGNMYIQCDPYTAQSQFGMISALLVKGHTASTASAPTAPASAVAARATNTATANTISLNGANAAVIDGSKVLSAYPNPFIQDFTLSVPAADNDKIVVLVADVSGKLVFQKQYEGLIQGTNQIRIQAGRTVPSGTYFVTVINLSKNDRKTIKVVKN